MAQQNTGASQLAQLTRPGSLNGGADARALYLKLFSGEMFKGFQHNAIARDLVMKRTLKNGKSLQFIYTGRTKAEFHVPGQSILGNDEKSPPVAEKTITVDDLLISSAFVYELDETLAHYELRGEISKKIGYALAQKYDRLIFRALARGARAASPITKANFVEPGGTQVQVGAGSNADDALDSTQLEVVYLSNLTRKSGDATDVTQDWSSLSLSYTVGGMTLGIVDQEVDNSTYTSGRTSEETAIQMTVAF